MKIEEEIQQEKFISPHQKAVINLLFTANWLSHRHQIFFKPYGITGQQFNVLRILKGQHPKSISAKELKSRMLDQNSDISRLLDRLETKRLIERKMCSKDKRASDVYITPEGIELLKKVNRNQNAIDHALALSDSEAKMLSDLLDKCRE
jgi:DNA-binding MarR family transcriptional regulator